MTEHIDAYPLCWPDGWRRTSFERRTPAQFHRTTTKTNTWGDGSSHSYKAKISLSVPDGVRRVLLELERMGLSGDDIVISTNMRTRLDGGIAGNQGEPQDPGVAVYWRVGKAMRCMAIDRYERLADNLAAVAATLDAMRAIERYGGAEILDRAFTGFVALPQPEQWWQVLSVKSSAGRMEIDAAYRALAMKHHPDRGGSDHEMARINAARDQGYEASPH
jgi:hypothetical protein